MTSISYQIKREAILYMEGLYLVKLWEVEFYDLSEEDKQVLRDYNQEVIDKYKGELLFIDLKIEMEM